MLLKATRPFEDLHGDRAGAVEKGADDLGCQQGGRDPVALLAIFGGIHRGGDVEPELQREAAGLIRRDRGGPEG